MPAMPWLLARCCTHRRVRGRGGHGLDSLSARAGTEKVRRRATSRASAATLRAACRAAPALHRRAAVRARDLRMRARRAPLGAGTTPAPRRSSAVPGPRRTGSTDASRGTGPGRPGTDTPCSSGLSLDEEQQLAERMRRLAQRVAIARLHRGGNPFVELDRLFTIVGVHLLQPLA